MVYLAVLVRISAVAEFNLASAAIAQPRGRVLTRSVASKGTATQPATSSCADADADADACSLMP